MAVPARTLGHGDPNTLLPLRRAGTLETEKQASEENTKAASPGQQLSILFVLNSNVRSPAQFSGQRGPTLIASEHLYLFEFHSAPPAGAF